MIKVTRNTRRVEIQINSIGKRIKKGLRRAWNEIGADLTRDTRTLIKTGSRSGRTYVYKGRRHRASALGEVPANMSGRLARSINYKIRSWDSMEFGAGAHYAKYLEPKRPFLIKAINKGSRNTLNSIYEYTDAEIKR